MGINNSLPVQAWLPKTRTNCMKSWVCFDIGLRRTCSLETESSSRTASDGRGTMPRGRNGCVKTHPGCHVSDVKLKRFECLPEAPWATVSWWLSGLQFLCMEIYGEGCYHVTVTPMMISVSATAQVFSVSFLTAYVSVSPGTQA